MCGGKKKQPIIEQKCLYCPLVACDCMLPPWLRAKVRQSYCNYQWGQNPIVQVPCPGAADYRSWWCKQLRKQMDICTNAEFRNRTAASTSYDANQSTARRQCSQICWCSNNVTSRSVGNIPSFAYQSSNDSQCTDTNPQINSTGPPAVHQDPFDTTANKSLPNIPRQPQFSPSEQNHMTCVHEVEVRNWSMDKNYQTMDNCNNCQSPQQLNQTQLTQPQFNQFQQHQENQTRQDQTLFNQLTHIEQTERKLNQTQVQQQELNQTQMCPFQAHQQHPLKQSELNQPPICQPHQTQFNQSEMNPLQLQQTLINQTQQNYPPVNLPQLNQTQLNQSEMNPLQLQQAQMNQPHFNQAQLNQTQFNQSELKKLQYYAPAYPNIKNAGSPCCQGSQGCGGNIMMNTGNLHPNGVYPSNNKRGRWSFKDFISKKTHASAPAPQLVQVPEQTMGTCTGCQCKYPPAYNQTCVGMKDGTCNCGQK